MVKILFFRIKLLIGAIGEDSCGRKRLVETPQAKARGGSTNAPWVAVPSAEINSGVLSEQNIKKCLSTM